MTEILAKVKELLRNKQNIFITGGGGVGKSYLLNQLTQEFDITVTSTTGIAALNVNGQTIHSWSGIGILNKPVESVIKNIKQNKKKLNQIQSTKILAIDEISMLDNYTLEYLDELLREVIGSSKPFGGLPVIFIGDFFQLPPVDLGKMKNNRIIDFCFNSEVWKSLKLNCIYLKKVWRQKDEKLITCLNAIRTGDNTCTSIFETCNTIPDKDSIRLYATNQEVDAYNWQEYKKIVKPEYLYESKDYLSCWVKGQKTLLDPFNPNVSNWDKQLYKSFDQNCKAKRVIGLKLGTRVMLLKNLNVNKGLVNGSCGYIVDLTPHTAVVEFDNGIKYTIEPQEFELQQNGVTKIQRTQLPLTLAYACSIHKSQGLTFDKVFIDLKRIFTFGQAYVALSRVKTLNGLFIQNFDPFKIRANPTVIDFYKKLEKTT